MSSSLFELEQLPACVGISCLCLSGILTFDFLSISIFGILYFWGVSVEKCRACVARYKRRRISNSIHREKACLSRLAPRAFSLSFFGVSRGIVPSFVGCNRYIIHSKSIPAFTVKFLFQSLDFLVVFRCCRRVGGGGGGDERNVILASEKKWTKSEKIRKVGLESTSGVQNARRELKGMGSKRRRLLLFSTVHRYCTTVSGENFQEPLTVSFTP